MKAEQHPKSLLQLSSTRLSESRDFRFHIVLKYRRNVTTFFCCSSIRNDDEFMKITGPKIVREKPQEILAGDFRNNF